MSNQSEASKKSALGLVIILVLATLVVYSPALNNTPLFDESYLLAWLSHCLHCGLTSNDTSDYLLSSPVDPRDGGSILGSASLLLTAMLTGTNYALMRWLQVLLHLANGLLLGIAVGGAIDYRWDGWRGLILAFSAALIFCIFPLTPEAASWLFGLPLEVATTCVLTTTAILLWLDTPLFDDTNRSRISLIAAVVLGIISPWLAPQAAPAFLIPVALMAARAVRPSRKIILALAAITLSGIAVGAINFSRPQPSGGMVPETIQQLRIEKIADSDGDKAGTNILNSDFAANLQAIFLPVNRNIDVKYNKVLRTLYIFLPLALLFYVAANITGSSFRRLSLGSVAAMTTFAVLVGSGVDSQNFYGARWLYPLLPLASIVWATFCVSPLFISLSFSKNEDARIFSAIKYGVAIVLIAIMAVFFFQRTFRQNLSYKSNGKLWQAVRKTIATAGQKQTSPFIIARGLPQSLSITPILSPFSPLLIDVQSGLPRTASLSAGRLKEALRGGKYTGLLLHYEKAWNDFAATDLNIVDKAFGPQINAATIARQLSPPLMYYKGAIKLDDSNENILMTSRSSIGAALSMQAYGLSPTAGDFLYVDAKIGRGQIKDSDGRAKLELHWLTNWQGDWDPRDRKVVTEGVTGDGQYHKYYFPLRTLAWITSGLPTNIMLGFPGGADVALRSIGLASDVPLPALSIKPVHRADANKNYFSHFCFNYPEIDDLGLSAVYGRDNGLVLNYDVSKVAGAGEALVEVVPAMESFRYENSTEPIAVSKKIIAPGSSGELRLTAAQLGGDGLYSIRVFAAGADHKLIGPAGDSLKCLIDSRL